ncbi:MAG: cytochrome B [Candidatus Fluviicola riflensis]|nr:MAG: cytochrome B [Candidatus Fluviicola riflensis]OGS77425.1 MAG: cytochrome B [Candidatus Fluviicola riflensis]OGS84005.1 MAG: cytochrome B [Fluviicola sp. RIFCSPHIGHO2_12_FULL_43_24]OGS84492.1 MAG: cytochrome B [Fluviicola sp. RIFCSPHIGHO2_01_FULL_43_53]
MEALIHTHSGLRWVVLILLLVAIGRAFARKNSSLYDKSDKMINLFTMVSLHTQLLLGLILYFASPKVVFVEGWMKVSQARFYGMEHIAIMVIAIALVTIGRRKAENATEPAKKHKTIAVWYTIGLILILASIPWPFRNLGAGWF